MVGTLVGNLLSATTRRGVDQPQHHTASLCRASGGQDMIEKDTATYLGSCVGQRLYGSPKHARTVRQRLPHGPVRRWHRVGSRTGSL